MGKPKHFFLPREDGKILKARLLKIVKAHPRSVCKPFGEHTVARRVKAELLSAEKIFRKQGWNRGASKLRPLIFWGEAFFIFAPQKTRRKNYG